jgi:ParB family chromosome partitioning protein
MGGGDRRRLRRDSLAEGETRESRGTIPASSDGQRTVITIGDGEPDDDDDNDSDDAVKPLPERLVAEADRTVALRDAVANNPLSQPHRDM